MHRQRILQGILLAGCACGVPAYAATSPAVWLSNAANQISTTVSTASNTLRQAGATVVTTVAATVKTATTASVPSSVSSIAPVSLPAIPLPANLTPDALIAGVQALASIPVSIGLNLAQGVSDIVQTGLRPEPGDYNAVEIALHMVAPEPADRPVGPQDRTLSFQPQPFTASGFSRYKYFVWQEVEAPAATGIKCADGSPYRFYVNLSPDRKKPRH